MFHCGSGFIDQADRGPDSGLESPSYRQPRRLVAIRAMPSGTASYVATVCSIFVSMLGKLAFVWLARRRSEASGNLPAGARGYGAAPSEPETEGWRVYRMALFTQVDITTTWGYHGISMEVRCG